MYVTSVWCSRVKLQNVSVFELLNHVHPCSLKTCFRMSINYNFTYQNQLYFVLVPEICIILHRQYIYFHNIKITFRSFQSMAAWSPHRFSAAALMSCAPKWWVFWRKETWKRFPSSERVRLLQPLLPRPQEGWWSKTHPLSQTSESRRYEMAIQDDYIEADPLTNMPRGLVLFPGSERRLLSHPDSPPPPHTHTQAALEICLWGSGLSIHSFWAVPGSPHFYEVHGCSSFPAETDGNPHPELPWRLAHFGQVGGRASISQIHAP